MKHKKEFVCRENLEFIKQNKALKMTFKSCLDELRRMSENEFFNGYSLFDILEMGKQRKRLIF